MTKNRNNNSGRRRRNNNNNNQRNKNGVMSRLVSLQDQTRNRMEPSVPDVPRMILAPHRVHSVQLAYMSGLITANSTAPNNGALNFTLTNFPDYSSWTSCFDSFRIIQIVIEFVPYGVGITGSTQTNGTFFTCLDYDDATPIGATDILQYDTRQIVPSGQYFERRLTPHALNVQYQGATSAYGETPSRQWIDTTYPATQYFGLKYSATISSSAVTLYSPMITAVIQFKNTV